MSTVTQNEFARLPEDMQVDTVLLKGIAILVVLGVFAAMVMIP